MTDASIESFIRSEQKGARSLAHLNREYSFRDRESSDWILITPNGFADIAEEAAESCRKLSESVDTTVVMTCGQGNCSGMVFAVFEGGVLKRHVSAADGYLCANVGEPFSWEPDVFGDLNGEEVAIFESTLEKVADCLGLSGYESSEVWTVDHKVTLSSPPPLPN